MRRNVYDLRHSWIRIQQFPGALGDGGLFLAEMAGAEHRPQQPRTGAHVPADRWSDAERVRQRHFTVPACPRRLDQAMVGQQ